VALVSRTVVVLLVGCGRVNFGYPVVPCEEVSADEVMRWIENDHCYTRSDAPQSDPQAMATCHAIGGHATTFTTPEENDAVAAGLSLTAPARLGGISTSGGGWMWRTSEPMPFAPWAPGEPSGLACSSGSVTLLLAPDGTWVTTCPGAEHPISCEIEPWSVREEDGHGYRVYWGNGDWYNASAACEQFGGYLAVITSRDELAFVAPLIVQGSWLGGFTTDTATLEWVTGESFTFGSWGTSEPDGTPSECVTSATTQEWMTAPCSSSQIALCEREP
jgi:hypothetical protein